METPHTMLERQPESWPWLLLKKWLSFRETGDDFDRDSDSNAEDFSESEGFEDSNGVEGSSDEDTRGLTELDLDTNASSNADSQHNNPLLREPSEILCEQFVVNNKYNRITWLEDLNYRIDLPDEETWILVNQCDCKSLLSKDQLKVERDAGRVFQGWHECYKFSTDV